MTFLSGVFLPLTSAEACEKNVGGFGKKSCVSTGVRKPGNTWVTNGHDMTLPVKMALDPNTTNQPRKGVEKPSNISITVTPPFQLAIFTEN